MTSKKKLFFIIPVILLASVLVAIYFYFRPPQTLADVVGHRFMDPDQITILNSNNGYKRELKDDDREEMLDLLRKAQIHKIEYTDMMDGSIGIEFFEGDDWFMLEIVGEYCFRITNPDDLSQLIVYHVDKESYKKIEELMKLP